MFNQVEEENCYIRKSSRSSLKIKIPVGIIPEKKEDSFKVVSL
jgi:hypothetical protein